MTAGPVVAWELCSWCDVMVPAPHACPYVAPTCPTTDPAAAGEPCGRCKPCLDLQEASIAAQGDGLPLATDGSPSDLDHP
ncbi:hypothetical protein FHR32_005077 [Streptosporangium album]|uniref:Uncharacterized protein n=1 Tax=Streptosporangium album TaxID=47479 RepID=A0A7W7RYY1_9ACTN|nr:hypothetical protein [Streptosporangium album]MBB4940700.1 hypothetical protein [Streptosporangium album]